MCLTPIYIKNPNYIPGRPGQTPGRSGTCSVKYNESRYSVLKDTARYIAVPCGHCAQCLARRQSDLVQRAREMSKSCYALFCTATYNNQSLPSCHSIDKLTGETWTYHYADISDLQKMFKRIRKDEDLPPFKYLAVTEYGGKRHRPHFHYILFFPKSTCPLTLDELESRYDEIFRRQWKRNLSKSTKYPIWQPLSDFISYFKPGVGRVGTYDVHAIRPTLNDPDGTDVAFYVTKYALKFDKWINSVKSALYYNSDNYAEVWKLLKPKMMLSKQFGWTPDTEAYIRHCVQWCRQNAPENGPRYINPDGKTFPLAGYYKNHFYTDENKVRHCIPMITLSDAAAFALADASIINTDQDATRSHDYTDADIQNWYHKQEKFRAIQDHLDQDLFDYILDDLE